MAHLAPQTETGALGDCAVCGEYQLYASERPALLAQLAPEGTVLVRCGTQMLADMAGNGMSEPLVLVGIERHGDGAYNLILRRPSRAVLQAAIDERFRA